MPFESPNYTQVPNDFFDMIADMSDAELRATLVVVRETFGYHRDAAKVGIAEIGNRAGLSYNGAVAGCEAAAERGTFKRTNPSTKTKAEWILAVQTPSASEGVLDEHPQPVREAPSASEGQVRLKKGKKKDSKQLLANAGERKANQIPEVVLFRETTGRYPARLTFGKVCAAVEKCSARLGRPACADDLRPFAEAWAGKGYNPNAITWLTEWAVSGNIPQNGAKKYAGNSAGNNQASELKEPTPAEIEQARRVLARRDPAYAGAD